MNLTRIVGAGALALSLGLPAFADESKADAKSSFAALKAELMAANVKFQEEMKAKGTADGVVRSEDTPGPAFARRFLRFAKDHPGTPEALASLNLAIQTGYTGKGGDVWDDVIGFIRERYLADPAVKQFYPWLSVDNGDTASESLLREILAKNPDRDTRGGAAQTLVKRVERDAEFAEMIKSTPESLKAYEEREGKAKLDELLAKGVRAKGEAEALKDSFRSDYADFFPAIAIGKPAPEVVSQDVEGHEVRLSSLKGKVVVLDIWTTWCGPCRAMIPHEREMVGRLKEKPFALVSISCDEEKSALTGFLAKESMPWSQWWNGATGGISSAWDVRYYPTIYVIDAAGVIRSKDLRGEELEKVVGELLAEPSAQVPR